MREGKRLLTGTARALRIRVDLSYHASQTLHVPQRQIAVPHDLAPTLEGGTQLGVSPLGLRLGHVRRHALDIDASHVDAVYIGLDPVRAGLVKPLLTAGRLCHSPGLRVPAGELCRPLLLEGGLLVLDVGLHLPDCGLRIRGLALRN